MRKTNSNLEFRKIKSLKYLYEVNENGTIFRNVKSKKQLKIKLDYHHSENGYYATFVHIGGRKNSKIKRVMIHRAVAECWLGDCPCGYEVDHIDRNSHNNDYRNLRYVTKSLQMKNRDHSNISRTGAQNLHTARMQRAKPVTAIFRNTKIDFPSYAECSRFLADVYDKNYRVFMWRLGDKRSHIYDFDIVYRNAETGHGSSTERGTVHNENRYDLTTDYRNFNAGKIKECLDRVKHSNYTDFNQMRDETE